MYFTIVSKVEHDWNTVEYRYNAVQYCMLLYKQLQGLRQNINQILDDGSPNDTPYPALTGELWGVFCEYLWENWSRYNNTALYYAKKMAGRIIKKASAKNRH